MVKYEYSIKIIKASIHDECQELEKILNLYAKDGYRVMSVQKTDNIVYEGYYKYTLVLEKKLK